jgi:predicted hydrocarbon binding protein
MLKERKTDNFSMRIYLETIESVVGRHGLKSILNYAHLQKYIDNFPPLNTNLEIPLEDLQYLCRSLLELFGKRGIRSLQKHIGRQIIIRSLEKRSIFVKGLFLLRFLIPESLRMKGALHEFVRIIRVKYPPVSTRKKDYIQLKEEKDFFVFIHYNNWESEDIISPSPVCHVTVGALEAFVEWVTGHVYEVKEIECRAMGHPADVFAISKSYTQPEKWVDFHSEQHHNVFILHDKTIR